VGTKLKNHILWEQKLGLINFCGNKVLWEQSCFRPILVKYFVGTKILELTLWEQKIAENA